MRRPYSIAMSLVGAALIEWGLHSNWGHYGAGELSLVAAGVLAVLLALLWARDPLPVWGVAAAVLLTWEITAVARPTTDHYASGGWFIAVRSIALGLPLLGVAAVALREPLSRYLGGAVIAAGLVGMLATIRAAPRPNIDVWYFSQHAASCVVHFCNPYRMTTPASPQWQDGFPYLPGSALLMTPAKMLLGDVRYADVASILAAALLIRREASGRYRRLSPLLVCVPGLFLLVENALTEALLIGPLVAAVVVASRPVDRSRWMLSAVMFGIALGSKQHIWLLLPVAYLTLGRRITVLATAVGGMICLPWLVADPSAFWHNTVTVFTDLPAAADSLSMWRHEPAWAHTAGVAVALAIAYAVVWWTGRGTPRRFLVGSAVVLGAFDLMNKQTYLQQWMLVVWLLVAAAALEVSSRTAPDGAEQASPEQPPAPTVRPMAQPA